MVILLGIIAAAANVFGGWVLSSQKDIDRLALRFLVASGAGFMLSATLLEIIPKSLQQPISYAPYLILLGYLFIQLAEHTIASHFHFGEEVHEQAVLHRHVPITALAGLTLHSFFDGVLIAASFAVASTLGYLVFVALFLHKIPEGFTASSIMRAAGYSRRISRLASEIIGLATLLGVLSFHAYPDALAYALPFSAGVTLYVAASDLIPEVNREEGVMTSLFVFGGVLLYFLCEQLLKTFLPA